jgi:hypothetical protein
MELGVPEKDSSEGQPRIRRLTPEGVALSFFGRFSKGVAGKGGLGSSGTTPDLQPGYSRPTGVMD